MIPSLLAAASFTIPSFTLTAPPVVSSLSPTSGPPGIMVTITGASLTGATVVDFGPTPAPTFTVNSPTTIVAKAPAGSGTVAVTVTTPGGTSQ